MTVRNSGSFSRNFKKTALIAIAAIAVTLTSCGSPQQGSETTTFTAELENGATVECVTVTGINGSPTIDCIEDSYTFEVGVTN